jgi:hypothetical protein
MSIFFASRKCAECRTYVTVAVDNFCVLSITIYCLSVSLIYEFITGISEHRLQGDSKLLSGFLWPINGNHDNNFELPCAF